MPDYRLYHLKENRFVGVDNFHAPNDTQAITEAKMLNGTSASELWEGGRKITTLLPDEEGVRRSKAAPLNLKSDLTVSGSWRRSTSPC